MPSGGPRTPSSPAPASGPGALSQRTDGGPGQKARYMSGGEYGEGEEMMNLQQAAPMSAAPGASRSAGRAARGAPARKAPSLTDPTARPDEPLTAGADFGSGAGSNALVHGGDDMGAVQDMDLQAIVPYLPSLLRMADGDAPEGFKRFVRYLRNVG